ncbi:MAG: chromate resistance protein [Chloroflexota bacterium]|nr:chromate resistance protein [Chloroflexota bacterium]
MKWVTRKGIKFDRTAGVWLILRFIDPDAEFDFVSGDEMPAALAAGAQPFHNYAWTGNPADLPAERLNLPGLIAKYGLAEREPALTLFAESVQKGERAGWAKPGYENEGLWAIANGLWLLADRDDAAFAQRMLPMYDALFAYCQMRATGGSGWQGDA